MALFKKKDGLSNDWTGWLAFTAILLVVLGSFHAIAGIVALFESEIYSAGSGTMWILSHASWGWIHIIWGLLAVWSGSLLASQNVYGHIFTVLVAVVSAIVSLAFVPVYPVWAVVLIALDVLIIYAVTVHGKEISASEK